RSWLQRSSSRKNRAAEPARPGDDSQSALGTGPRWRRSARYAAAPAVPSPVRAFGWEWRNRGGQAGPGGESGQIGARSATLSARARQLTPQAIEREGQWRAAAVRGGDPG